MRVINLDETGIKLLNNKKRQIYISRADLFDLVAGNYCFKDNVFYFKDMSLPVSNEEIDNFSIILRYISTEVLKLNL